MAALAHRLPTTIWPESYAIDITTDPDRPNFFGHLEVVLDVRVATRVIEMHAKGLSLSQAQVEAKGTQDAQIEFQSATETVTFTVAQPLPVGRAILRLDFAGQPNPGMHGLYLAEDGEERAICTQCEATDCRAIFPCFDEPEFKATFTWTIRARSEFVALANGPQVGLQEEQGLKVWRFAATERVSSYLAALAVGRFEGTETTLSANIPVRVWAPRGKREQARFAHGFTERLIPWYEDYFGIRYPYGKYDQVAVPGFDAGAMENVGLVLFRQNLLLMDPRAASWNQEKLIAKVIAHELAHMWFGNLVTMRWWDDLWLNEAFAEWFAHKAADAAAPSYLVWNDFQADKNRALQDDALQTTHAIYAPVATPSEAIEMFDVITYQKGCAVMRMLEHFLGETTFRDGIRAYMRAFSGKNARGEDLWNHLGSVSGQPVGAMMHSWIEQPGFPLLRVSLQGQSLRISQRRFFSSPDAAGERNQQHWTVPVVVRFADQEGIKTHRFLFGAQEHAETLPSVGKIRWLCANAEEIGFYRVDPQGELRQEILTHALDNFTAVEQMGFIEDQWALVRNNTRSVVDFLPVIKAFAPSRDHNVIRSLADRLSSLDVLLEEEGDEATRARLRAWVIQLFSQHLDELGYEPRPGEPQNDLQRRALVISLLGNLAQKADVVAESEKLADRERTGPREVDPNLAGTFVGIAARFGDTARYELWIKTYLERRQRGSAPQDSLRYLYTLAMFRAEFLAERTLGHVDDNTIPQEAVGAVIAQLLGTRHGQKATWVYLQDHWAALRARVGDMGISRVVEAVGRLPNNFRQEVISFFEANPPVGAERALARALESMQQREELRQRVVPALAKNLT